MIKLALLCALRDILAIWIENFISLSTLTPKSTWANNWGLCPFEGVLGPHLTQYRLGRGLPPYQVASSSIQPFGHNRRGPKIGVCAPLGEELGPHLIQCGQGRCLLSCPVTSRSILPFGHNTPTSDSQTGQTEQTTVRYRGAKRFTNGRPKTGLYFWRRMQ